MLQVSWVWAHTCHHSNSLQPVTGSSLVRMPAFSLQAVGRAVQVRALLSDVAPAAATLPSAASSVEARRPRECPTCNRRGAYRRMQLGRWPKPSSLFWLKGSRSLFQLGRDQVKPAEPLCLQGPPGPPGPQGPEVRAKSKGSKSELSSV